MKLSDPFRLAIALSSVLCACVIPCWGQQGTSSPNVTKGQLCQFTVSDQVGRIVVTSSFFTSYTSCQWQIQGEGADSVTVFLHKFCLQTAAQNVDNDPQQQNQPGDFEVSMYRTENRDPSDLLYTWRSSEEEVTLSFSLESLFLTVQPSDETGEYQDVENSAFRIDYITWSTVNSSVGCEPNTFNVPEHGTLQVINTTLGSEAEVMCSEGYLPQGVTSSLVCVVSEDSTLSWQPRTREQNFTCESVCLHPPAVPHTRVRLVLDEYTEFTRTPERLIPRHTVRSTGYVSCEEPYLLTGATVWNCSRDVQGVPTWHNANATACIIPDCSSTTTLTEESGAIVNPSFPSDVFGGDGVTCAWEVVAPSQAQISFYFQYLDLPDDPSIDFRITDTGGPRPVSLLHFQGQGLSVNASSVTNRVLVTYTRSASDLSGHRGFYLKYVTRSDVSLRQEPPPALLGTFARSLNTGTSAPSTESNTLANEPQTPAPNVENDTPQNTPQTSITDKATTEAESSSTPTPSTSDITSLPPTTPTPAQPTSDITSQPPTTPTPATSTSDITSQPPTTPTPATSTSDITSQPPTTPTPATSTSDIASQPPTTPTPAPSTSGIPPQPMTTPTNVPMVKTDTTVTPTGHPTTSENTGVVSGEVTQATESSGGTLRPSPSTGSISSSPVTSEAPPKPTVPPTERAGNSTHVPQAAEESSSSWKIAVGVIIPLLIIGAVAIVIYICYRKKYPVRMIIGREFGKFSNPQYSTPKRAPTLVRPDADDYFTASGEESGEITVEYNPVDNRITFDNAGFVNDEDEDEEEKERKFLARKSWLFKKGEDEVREVDTTDSADGTPGRSVERRQGKGTEDVESTDTDVSEMLGQQQLTPKPKPRNKHKSKNRAAAESSASSTGTLEEKSGSLQDARTVSLKNNQDDGQASDEDQVESNFEKTSRLLFEQPTFEEVCADIKARSRSMSVDRAMAFTARPRSFSVNPSKSARRNSLFDETLFEAQKRKTKPPKKMTSVENLHDFPALTASVVGVDYRDKTASMASFDFSLGDDNDGVPRNISPGDRDRGVSLSSANSNPHLVTDLDDDDRNTDQEGSQKHVSDDEEYEEQHDEKNILNKERSDSKLNIEERFARATAILTRSRAKSLDEEGPGAKEQNKRSQSFSNFLDSTDADIDHIDMAALKSIQAPSKSSVFDDDPDLSSPVGRAGTTFYDNEQSTFPTNGQQRTEASFFSLQLQPSLDETDLPFTESQDVPVPGSYGSVPSPGRIRVLTFGEVGQREDGNQTEADDSTDGDKSDDDDVIGGDNSHGRKLRFVLPSTEELGGGRDDDDEGAETSGTSNTNTSDESEIEASYTFEKSEPQIQTTGQNRKSEADSSTSKSGSESSFEVLPPEMSRNLQLFPSSSSTVSSPIPQMFPRVDDQRAEEGARPRPVKLMSERTYSDSSSESTDPQVTTLQLTKPEELDMGNMQPRTVSKIHPSVELDNSFSISDDDDDDDDNENKGHKLTDDDISEVLGDGSSTSDTSSDTDAAPGRKSRALYTFRDENSEDEDIDV
ncbi:uncharacterized protein LOC101859524 isoform X2 [Aplysia californica]|uniref:Uncharacterized protein LOC101859524 isoform X2 n=1 Tax=Aplysia californica TaxID=6500 RepID=A0ABM0JA14_APLCA|nr:uncharacterized protein LOC101859524 isoform X2 [Aplysia californica]